MAATAITVTATTTSAPQTRFTTTLLPRVGRVRRSSRGGRRGTSPPPGDPPQVADVVRPCVRGAGPVAAPVVRARPTRVLGALRVHRVEGQPPTCRSAQRAAAH